MKTFRSKGLGYEIEIAKKLSVWITGDKSKKVLWRSMGSGCLSTRKLVDIDGDISPIHPDGEDFCKLFVIECKRRNKINMSLLLYNTETCEIMQFWKQTLDASIRTKKIPLLIIKENYKQDLIVMHYSFFASLNVDIKRLSFYDCNNNIVITYLDDLLNSISYKDFMDISTKFTF